jgi:predicted AAA+ superfamily ATPase
VEKNLLKEVLLDQKQWLHSMQTGTPREKLQKITEHTSLPHCVLLSGIRRSGKSTLLTQIIDRAYSRDKVYFMNFDDERLVTFTVEDFPVLHEIFMELFGERNVFFLDEIQNVEKWELFVRRMQERGFKFFITGSNASLLSRELGTRLTGRNLLLEIFPFSFSEFLQFRGDEPLIHGTLLPIDRARLKTRFNEYLQQGGMPEFLKYGETELQKRLYEDIIYRDIAARHDIRDMKALREMGLYYFSTMGNLFSFNRLKSFLGVGSVNTVKSYTQFFEDAFLLFTIRGFSYSLAHQFLTPRKAYCIDNGINNAVSFRFSKDRGRFVENLVAVELKRRGRDIYYYKTARNGEVDFAIREGGRITALIQVSTDMSRGSTREREIRAISDAMDETKLSQALVLTEDEDTLMTLDKKQVTIKPLYRWLLEID